MLEDAQQILDSWRDEYNNEQPHSRLQDLPPAHFRPVGADHTDRFVQHSRGPVTSPARRAN